MHSPLKAVDEEQVTQMSQTLVMVQYSPAIQSLLLLHAFEGVVVATVAVVVAVTDMVVLITRSQASHEPSTASRRSLQSVQAVQPTKR